MLAFEFVFLSLSLSHKNSLVVPVPVRMISLLLCPPFPPLQGDEALSEDRIELDNQLHVFEAVMNKDLAEVGVKKPFTAVLERRETNVRETYLCEAFLLP